jgi:hypothetical protein
MAKGSGVRAVYGALMAAMSVALGISGAAADDLGSEEIGASDAGDAARMATDGGGRRLWSRQPGTSSDDQAYGVATEGNVYVVGGTGGALGGANEGAFDAWVSKFDGDGHRLWSRQFGTSTTDSATGVATDKNGNVYLVGYTFGALGGPNKGDADAWVSKFDGDGHQLWIRQFGTSADDFGVKSVATDQNGNFYVVGYTEGALGGFHKGGHDAWVIKFDGDGHQLWKRQPGTRDLDEADDVAIDADGNVYVVGITVGALGGPNKGAFDAWVIKFDGNGHQLWSRQPGTRDGEEAFGAATDTDGNVYLVGYTDGALGGPKKGDLDAWVIKFDGDGHRLWKRQPGTSASDLAIDVATDTDGNVYLVGYTFGALGGPNKGDADAWVIKFDSAGHGLWRRQPGTSAEERALHVAPDRDGVYVVGFTLGALGGPNMGGEDGWVIKYAR